MPSCSSTPMRGRGGDDALRAHAGLGQAEMDRVVRAARDLAVDRDEVLHRRDLGREDDPVLGQAESPRRARPRSSADCTIASRITARASIGRAELRVLVHQVGEERLVERAPVRADAHGLAVADRLLDDGRELRVLLLLEADIARVDPVLGQRLGAGRMVGEELVADVVEVADQRHVRRRCGRAARGSSARRPPPRRGRP